MWIWEIIKNLVASWRKSQATEAAASIPAIDSAIDAVKKDGDTIREQLKTASTNPPK